MHKDRPVIAGRSQSVEKARFAIFSAGIAPFSYSPLARRAANGVRKALLRKATEPTAHVAGLGTKVRGLQSSDTSHGFVDSLRPSGHCRTVFRYSISLNF